MNAMMNVDELPRELGRYVLYDQIASGGMATVHFGRMHGAIGFSRLVAIKRLHPTYVGDAHFVRMFLDEARLAARLEHPNVVSTIDVVANEAEVFIVMEHVLGETLDGLMPRKTRRSIPPSIASAIVCNILEGLHGAHEARGDAGEPLEIVHRDVSPHNVIVGVDGLARVFDFGIAKATTNTQETRAGVVKGKVTYMAPEQVRGATDRRADLYATGVILWELLAGRRRYAGEQNDALFLKLAMQQIEPPPALSSLRGDVPEEIDAVVTRATQIDPDHRYATAREMAVALEAAIPPAPAREVARWIREVAGARIDRIESVIRRIERDLQSSSSISLAPRTLSTGSVHAVTSSIIPNGTTSSVRPLDPSRASAPPEGAPARRKLVLPVAIAAFTSAMLLVGVRSISQPDPAASDVAPTLARAPARAEPLPLPAPTTAPLEASAAPEGESTLEKATAGEGSPQAERPRSVVRTALPSPPARAHGAAPRPQRDTAATAPARSESASPASVTHKINCDNPFSISPDGIRQIKPECM